VTGTKNCNLRWTNHPSGAPLAVEKKLGGIEGKKQQLEIGELQKATQRFEQKRSLGLRGMAVLQAKRNPQELQSWQRKPRASQRKGADQTEGRVEGCRATVRKENVKGN